VLSFPSSPTSPKGAWQQQAAAGRANAGDRARQVPAEPTEEAHGPLAHALWALRHARCSRDVGQLNDSVMEASQYVSRWAYKVPSATFGSLEEGQDPKDMIVDKGQTQYYSYSSSSRTRSGRMNAGQTEEAEEKKKKIEAAEYLKVELHETRKDLRDCRSQLSYDVIAALRDGDANAVAGRLYDARRAGFGPGLIKLLEQRLSWMHENGEFRPERGIEDLSPTRGVPELTPRRASPPSPRTTPHATIGRRRDITLSHPDDNVTRGRMLRRARGKDGSAATVHKLEQKVIKEVFQMYDTDGTGAIDLQELNNMLRDLGAALQEEELQSVMQALDVNGNGRCNFEEFLAWWSAQASERTVNQSVYLAFMKAKLATEMALRKARAKLAQAEMKAVKAGEVSINGSLDVSTNIDGCPEGMSVTATLEHVASDSELDTNLLSVVLRTKSEVVAVKVSECLQELLQIIECTELVDVAPQQNKVVLTARPDQEMADSLSKNDESQVAESFLRRTFDKCEVQVSMGSTFYDIVDSPALSIFRKIAGARWRFSSMLNQGSLMAFAHDEVLASVIPCVSGLDFDFIVRCDEEFFQEAVNAMAQQCENLLGQELASLIPKSLSQQRDAFLEILQQEFEKEGENLDHIIHALQYLNRYVICVDSLSYTGLPGTSLALDLAFEDFNPFALAGFMVEPLVSRSQSADVPEASNAIRKSLSKEELTKLRVAFDSYDKDGSGAIDLKELQNMCSALGGNLTDREANEAMKQLDRDGDGKCDFQNFSRFWSSKPGLGGYSSIALKFMKLKLAAGSFLGKSMSALATSTRRSFKAMLELRSGLSALEPKMCTICSLQASSVSSPAKEGEALKLTLRLTAKSVDEASESSSKSSEIAQGIRELLAEFHDSLQMLPEIYVEEDGPCVSLSVCAPAELIAGMASELDLESLVPLVMQVLTSIGATVSFGSTFEDFVNSPDMPLRQLLGGICLTTTSNLKPPSPNSGGAGVAKQLTDKLSTAQIFAMRLFAGFDFSCRLRYDESKIAEMLQSWGIISDTAQAGLTLNDLRALVASNIDTIVPSDMAPTMSTARRLIDGLEAVESVTLQGPVALSADNATKMEVKVTAKFDHFNPFCLMSYILHSPAA